MSIKQKIQNLVLGGLLLIPVATAALLPAAPTFAAECGDVETAVINCDINEANPKKVEDTGVWGILILTINIMTAGVGVLALAGLVYGAVLYTSAGGSPEQVKKARTVFTNVVVGVVAFGGMSVLLNFLVPGGVFR